MLRLLLDEHLSAQIAVQVRGHNPQVDIVCMQEWRDGTLISGSDAVLLREAHREGRTLVTRDARTIPPLLRDWGERKIAHGGVIFVDHRSFAEGTVGTLVMALLALWEAEQDTDWTDAVRYLRR